MKCIAQNVQLNWKDKVMVNTVVISNVDRELLSEQTLELVNLLWNKPDSKLWGLVEMLNSWYDNGNSSVKG